MEPVLVLRARTEAGLDEVGPWVLDSWLEAPLAPLSEDGTLRLTLHKAPDEAIPGADAAALRTSVPRPRNQAESEAGTSYERPVVVCELAIRSVEAVERAPEYGLPISNGITYDARRRVVALDDELLVRVSELAVELAVTSTVVGWELVRVGRIGPVSYERVIPMPDG
jgi:hypothetical protein